ncbi:ABC transporter substrate-binding protein [Paenibacillus oceani]|uniref:Extracellular solute-binding protein n=1 Tax=Paenibacillus oceani TaxID=2772510 RepID=A0A927C6K5_9BACL|nr:extracellular solute-binding protein [Paenibacillus oceani]MBD2862155.1 extracellular solute-binding protein [Paenibacillus oceani]
MVFSKKWKQAACVPLAMAVLAGCGADPKGTGDPGGAPGAGSGDKPPEPFTMTIYAAGVKPEEFDSRFRGTLEKKFPHITFDYQTSDKGNSITEKVARGEVPDIIRTDTPTMKSGYLDLQLGYDLRELVAKHKYDLNRFVPAFIQDNINTGQTGGLYGLPVPPYFPSVLYYNKDLFDKFGVPYPRDGMSWDEVYDLAVKMSRTDGGKVYRGFSSSLIALLRDNPYSLPILDPEKDGLADQTKWKSIFDNFKRFHQIPNNAVESTFALENAVFTKGQSAMYLGQHSIYFVVPPEVNWDIVSVPALTGAPKLMGQRTPAYWSITQQSKHKDEAFQVIMEMLSDEVQMQDSRNGIPTTLVNKEIREALGKSHPIYSKKNMKALTLYEPTDPTPKRGKDKANVSGSLQESIIWQSFVKTAQGQADVNTVLREADERLKQELEKEKNK